MTPETALASTDAIAIWWPVLAFASLLAVMLFGVGVVLAILAWRAARQTQRIRDTVQRFASYRNEHDQAKTDHVRRLIASGKLIGEEVRYGELADQDVAAMQFVLNEWDDIASCVRRGIYNEALVMEYFERVGLAFWQHLRPFIRHEQRTDASRWRALDRLAVQWMIRYRNDEQSPAIDELRVLSRRLEDVLGRLHR